MDFIKPLMGMMIPILGIFAGIIAIWTNHQRKMRQMELDAQLKISGSVSSAGDISSELQHAIKGEFERLRQENTALRDKLESIEQRLNTSLTSEVQAEIAKQRALEQRN